jgi:hypothetical protein
LEIRELHCPVCEIQMRGNFVTSAGGPFARLSEDQIAFLRLFVTSRGNLSDIERTLGVSYPTVRSKLDDLISAMTEPAPDFSNQPTQQISTAPAAAQPQLAQAQHAQAQQAHQPQQQAQSQLSRREILSRIADGRLTPQQGMEMMKQLSGDGA